MAEKKQNLVEEALLQMKNLEEAVTENAKGILASTMKEEISELVKESLSEEDAEEVEMEESATEKMESEEMEEGEDKMDHEMTEQEELDMMDVEDEVEDEMEDEMEDMEDMDDMEDEMDSDEMLMMDLPGDDMEVDDEEEILLPLDLTGASDEEILKVFKAMGEEDGIVVTQDGDEIHLKDEEADVEYQIQTEGDEEEEVIADEEEMEGEYKEGYEMEEEDEVVYEIELGEEDEMEDESEEVEDESEEEMKEGNWGGNKHDYKRRDGHKLGDVDGHYKDYEMEEGEEMEGEYKESSVRSNVNGRATNKKPQGFPKSLKRPAQRNEALEKEVAQLREKNEEYRKALNIFKEKLNEVAVFNSNLAYATRLFTEHSTTKQEKINILRRFDSAETIKESKGLYKTIKEDLDSKENSSVVTESVSAKVQKSPSKGSATNLIESKTYENPQFLRMKDLMGKLQK
jgi:hypothetical protein